MTGYRRRGSARPADLTRQVAFVVVLILLALVQLSAAVAQVEPLDDFDVLGVRVDQSTQVLFAAPPRRLTEPLTTSDVVVTIDGQPAQTRLQQLAAADLDLAVVIDTALPADDLRALQGAVVQLALELPQGATMRIVDAEGAVGPPATVPGPAIAQIRQLAPETGDDLQRAVADAVAALDGADAEQTALLVVGRDLGDRLRPIADQPFSRLVYVVDVGTTGSAGTVLGPRTTGIATTVDDVGSVLSATDKMARDVRNLYRATVEVPAGAQELTLRIPAERGEDPTRTIVLDGDAAGPAEQAEPAADTGAAVETVADPVASPRLDADLLRTLAVGAGIVAVVLLLLLAARRVVRRRRAQPPGAAPATEPLWMPPPDLDPAAAVADETRDAGNGTPGRDDADVPPTAGNGGAAARSSRSAPPTRPIAKLGPQTREALAHAHLGLRRLALASRGAADSVPDDLFRLAEARASVALSRQDVGLREVLTAALTGDEDADIALVQRSAQALATGWTHTSSRSSAPPPIVEINAVLTGRRADGPDHEPQRPVSPVRALNPLIELGMEHVVLATRSHRDSPLVARAVTVVDVMRTARLTRPVLMISPWLLADRAGYQTAFGADLSDAQQRDRWLEYLCTCIAKGANESAERLAKVGRLRIRHRERVDDPRVLPVIDLLLAQPVIDARYIMRRLSTSEETADELVAAVRRLGLLQPMHEPGNMWIADQVLSLFTDLATTQEWTSRSA